MTTDTAVVFPAALTLDQLPEHRRDLFLFRHISTLGFPDIWDQVQKDRCRLRPRGPALADRARLGSDGRWHWLRDGQMVCANGASHQYHQLYATDGTRYLRQQPESDRAKPPKEQIWRCDWLQLQWPVKLVASPELALAAVPPSRFSLKLASFSRPWRFLAQAPLW